MIFNNISFVSFEKEDNGNKKARVGKQKNQNTIKENKHSS